MKDICVCQQGTKVTEFEKFSGEKMASVTSVWWYANYRLMQETSMNEETLEGFCIDYEKHKII